MEGSLKLLCLNKINVALALRRLHLIINIVSKYQSCRNTWLVGKFNCCAIVEILSALVSSLMASFVWLVVIGRVTAWISRSW